MITGLKFLLISCDAWEIRIVLALMNNLVQMLVINACVNHKLLNFQVVLRHPQVKLSSRNRQPICT